GFLQFDSPSAINIDFSKSNFLKFFKKYIELHHQPVSKAVVDKAFRHTVEKMFYKPLENVIDLKYKVRKEQIPTLFFDYTLDGIGVNGGINTVKALDLNS